MLSKLAAVQMAVVDGDGEANRRRAFDLMDAAKGADLYLLPELWTSGYAFDAWTSAARDDTPLSLAWMSEQARLRRAFVGGSLIARNDDGSLANRLVLFSREGREVLRYDKCHLFPPMQEPLRLSAGNGAEVIEIEGMRVAPAICYDLRFPEMFRRAALRGVDLFLVPSEWPHPRQRSLSILAESRAIENQAFLLLANRCGGDAGETRFCGNSGLFGPFGAIATAGDGEAVVTAEIERASLDQARRALHVLDERRKGIDFD